MINIMRDGCLKPPASHDTSEIPSHLNIFEFKPVRFAEAHLGDESARLEVSLWGVFLRDDYHGPSRYLNPGSAGLKLAACHPCLLWCFRLGFHVSRARRPVNLSEAASELRLPAVGEGVPYSADEPNGSHSNWWSPWWPTQPDNGSSEKQKPTE